jgi:hypothetical protein
MKVIDVPYGKNVQRMINKISPIIFGISSILAILSLFNLNWIVFVISLLISIVIGIYYWNILTMRLLIRTNDFAFIRIIAKVDNYGFVLYDPLKGKEHRFEWNDMEYFKLGEHKRLTIKPLKGEAFNLTQQMDNWYLLLSKIPNSKLLDTEIPDFLNTIEQEAKLCKICGLIALHRGQCLSCGSEPFNKKEHNFANEKTYLKEQQLEVFSMDNDKEKVDFYKPSFFKKDETWRPLVTESEVIAYSEENY